MLHIYMNKLQSAYSMDKMIIFSARKLTWNRLILIICMLYGITSGKNEAVVHKIEVLVNDMVSIHCHTNASIDIQWHFNSHLNYVFAGGGLKVPYLGRFRTENDNAGTHILIIPKVRSEDAGWYYCSEEDTGRRISSTHLTVLYSDPVCFSNMHLDGFIGPNTCNLQQEKMVFNCVVSFNGTSPHLTWRLLNDNQTLNSSICEDKPNRRNCSLILKSDPMYDGSIFICQTTASIDSSFNCSTKVTKILYFYADRSVTQKKVNENINCAVRSNLNFKYNWNFEQGNTYTSLSANHTLVIKEPGIYQCEVEYSIRNVSCVFLVSAAAVAVAVVEGNTVLPIVLPLVGLIIVLVGFVLFIERRRRKQKRNRKNEKLELTNLLRTENDEKLELKNLLKTQNDEKLELKNLLKTRENENKDLRSVIEDTKNMVKLKNNKIKYQVISIYKEFVSEVDPVNVFDLLVKNGIVLQEEKQNIMNNVTAKEGCRALIDLLFCCSKENAFIILRKALKEHYPRITGRLKTIDSDDENEDDYSTSKLENEKIRNKIFGMQSDFVSDVDPVNVFDFLIQSKIVNIKQKQFILKERSKKEERCRALLDHLTFSSKEKAFIILKEALMEHYPGIVERIDTFNEDNAIEFSTRFESCIIVVGLENDDGIDQDVVKIKVNGKGEVSTIGQLPHPMDRESAAVVYDNSLFVTGLGENWDKIWKFDARSSKWEYCNSMIRGRRRHSVAFVDHVLYICGGWVNDGEITLDDVEAYDTIDDRCTTVGRLVHAIESSDNCVPFKSSLYIFGGCDAKGNSVNYIQVFDTKLNSCSLISKRMPVAYYHLRDVLWENKAILLGHRKCFIYNFDTGTFQMRDQFKTDVVYFGMIVHNGKLFVIGGGHATEDVGGTVKWIYRDDVRSVPIANVLNDESIEWSHHAKLPKPSQVQSFGKMEFPMQ